MPDQEEITICFSPEGAASEVQAALGLLEGRWKKTIIFHLFASEVLRFSELERAISGVSQKVLAQQLRELERDELVTRTVHAEVPPRVEYRLTEIGKELRPVLQAIRLWSRTLRRSEGTPARSVGIN